MDDNLYPIPGFHFSVQFKPGFDKEKLGIAEVSGLTLGNPSQGEKAVKRIILRRGLFPASKFSDWYKESLEQNKSNPRDVEIFLLDRKEKKLAGWKASSATPVAWYADPFISDLNAIAMETIELAYKKLQRIL